MTDFFFPKPKEPKQVILKAPKPDMVEEVRRPRSGLGSTILTSYLGITEDTYGGKKLLSGNE